VSSCHDVRLMPTDWQKHSRPSETPAAQYTIWTTQDELLSVSITFLVSLYSLELVRGEKREKIWTFSFLRSNLHLLLISQSLPLTKRILMKGRVRALLGSRRTWRQERMQAGDGTAATIYIWVQSVCRLLKWMFK